MGSTGVREMKLIKMLLAYIDMRAKQAAEYDNYIAGQAGVF